MAYCEPADLLTGDMTVMPDRAEAFISAAAEEMDMKLGMVYELPLSGLETAADLALKRCNVLLATGRLVMAQAVASEDYSPNAYGVYLMREARDLLAAMVSGDIALVGAVPVTPAYGLRSNAVSILNEDSVSAVDAFYGFAMRGERTQYRPGI